MGVYDAGLGRPNGGARTATIHQQPPRIGGVTGGCGCGGDCGGVGSKAGCGCSSCAAGAARPTAPRLPLLFLPVANGWSSMRDRPRVLPTGWSPRGAPWEVPQAAMQPPPLGTPGRAGAALSMQLLEELAINARHGGPEIDGLRRRAAARGWEQGVGVVPPTRAPYGLAWSEQNGEENVASDEVYIFLSAGPRVESTGAACTPSNTQTCSLWRIHWSFTEMKALEVLQVRRALPPQAPWEIVPRHCPGWLGFADPAAGTRGRVAYVERCHDADGTATWASVVAEDVGGRREKAFVGSVGEVTAAYPAWLGERIFFNLSTQWVSTLWLTSPWPAFATVGPYLGPGGAVAEGVSFSDPNVLEDAETGGPRIVTFGGWCDTDGDGKCGAGDDDDVIAPPGFDENDVRELGWERIPRTFHPFYIGHNVAGLPYEDGFSNQGTPLLFSECHHPAWRPDGQAFLCTRYHEAEVMSEDETGCGVRRLYSFSYADGYASGSPLTAIPTREEIRRIPKTVGGTVIADIMWGGVDLFMMREGTPDTFEGCGAYVWKFAEWCGSADWAVATLYCSENSSSQNSVRHSRVVLIDVRPGSDTTSAEAYVDLTSWIEFEIDAPAGSMDGAFSSCATVPIY